MRNVTVVEYMLWRLARAVLILITAPIWFPFLCVFAATGSFTELILDKYDEWMYDYEQMQKEKRHG